jgi:hypothetical protein
VQAFANNIASHAHAINTYLVSTDIYIKATEMENALLEKNPTAFGTAYIPR